MKAIFALGALALAGCATAPADGEPAACRGDRAASLVGQAATSEAGAEAMRLTGARMLRWIRPGDAVTMDYRPERLNVHLDAQGRIARFDCG